ncbi:iron-sulfur cluster assembly scaffold protein [Paenalcaligenes niemegkensis]|uniref:iron-sulfur cluster assembly scaffold protein n=1 Tax=Paenalcaligenes niemegkensis TaxID=2895469 RepID=UPI001EE895F3|nr:iron-sulfur cluster assembly scaffold protein [Paenalcaligenes niemegkensis]MCQ9616583.1 iron-sulfur cluster assembly scaffold protein [Paenalcaligenes niemegkensis]
MRYNAKVETYFKYPTHAGLLDVSSDTVRSASVGGVEQGAALLLQVELDGEQRIEKARFKAYGCGATIAAAEYVSVWAEGKYLHQLSELSSNEVAQALELPAVKVHSSMLAVQALRALA